MNREMSNKHKGNSRVAPETLILTKGGHKRIDQLLGKSIEIWNGNEWSIVKCEKTGENKRIINVILDDGSSLSCTPHHEFYVDKDNWCWSSDPESNKKSDIIKVKALNLKPGDKVRKYTINHTNDYQYASLMRVQEIINENRVDDTYYVNEPIRHAAIFNGILTSAGESPNNVGDDR